MAMPNGTPAIIRRIACLSGLVEMECDLAIRADCGRTVPWVEHRRPNEWHAIAGPDLFLLRTEVELHGEDLDAVGTFEPRGGEVCDFVLSHRRSFGAAPQPVDADAALEATRV
jgi:hypothetical protein